MLWNSATISCALVAKVGQHYSTTCFTFLVWFIANWLFLHFIILIILFNNTYFNVYAPAILPALDTFWEKPFSHSHNKILYYLPSCESDRYRVLPVVISLSGWYQNAIIHFLNVLIKNIKIKFMKINTLISTLIFFPKFAKSAKKKFM